jgi:hypothetical protein
MALEDGFEPPTRTPSTCRSTSELLQQLDPTPGIEPGPGGSANRRLPTWQGRVIWHQGKDLNPHFVVQSHVSYLLDHPGVFETWRPRRGSNPPPSARQAVVPSRGPRGRDEETWWRCAGEDSHLHSRWPRGYGPLGSLVPEPARVPPRVFGLPCLFGFQSAGPDSPGKKKGAWRRQAPC